MNIGRYIKRIVKFILISVVILLTTTGVLTYLFQDKIINYFIEEANQSLKTKITYDDISLNFFAEFPQVSIEITNPTIAGSLPDKEDTLAHMKSVYLSFDLLNLIDGKYEITALRLDDANIKMVRDLNKHINFDIIKKDTSSTTKADFSFNLKKITLNNVGFRYWDQPSSTDLHFLANNAEATLTIDSLINTSLKGDILIRDIKLKESNYFAQKNILLDLALVLNTEKEEIDFAPSTLTIDGGVFSLEGLLGYGSDAEADLVFSAQEGKIKSLISLLSHDMSNALGEYESEGDVYFNGSLKGKMSGGHSPQITIAFGFKNASFYHPSFKQKITHASLTGSFTNGSQHNASTSKIELKDFTAKLNGQPLSGYMEYSNFSNPYLKLKLKGDFDAASVLRFYPIKSIEGAKGTVKVNISIDGRINNLVDNAGLGKVRTNGSIVIENLGFVHTTKNMPYKDISGSFLFNGNDLKINNLEAKAGGSDMSFKGAFKNFMAYIFLEDQPLVIQASFSSTRLDLDELLSQSFTDIDNSQESEQSPEYVFSIPGKIELDLLCNVGNVKFRRMNEADELKNIKGHLFIKNQKVTFKNMALGFAGGQVIFEDCTPSNGYGINATAADGITVKSAIHFNDMDIHKAFFLFEDFTQHFITHEHLRGTLNADLVISKMVFDHNLHLNTQQLEVDVFNLSIVDGELVNFAPLVGLYDYLKDYKFGKLINLNIPKYFNKEDLSQNAFEHLKFERLSNEINIRNKVIDIPKMEIASNVTPFIIKGNHSFEGNMNYDIDVNLKNYKKINRQQESLSQYGEVMQDQTKGIWIYTSITGNTDDYNFEVNQEKMKKEFSRTLKESLAVPKEEEEDIYIAPDTDDDENFLEEEEF